MKNHPVYKVLEDDVTFVIGKSKLTNNYVLVAKYNKDSNLAQNTLFIIDFSSSKQVNECINSLKSLSIKLQKEGK